MQPRDGDDKQVVVAELLKISALEFPPFGVNWEKESLPSPNPSTSELLDAADRLREFLDIPRGVWLDSHGRHSSLNRVAILVATMAKPQGEFTRSRTAWARLMLTRQPDQIDIWATIRKLQACRVKLN